MKTLDQKIRRFASYAEIPKTYSELGGLYLPRPIHNDAEDAQATARMLGLAVFPRLVISNFLLWPLCDSATLR